MGRIFSDATPEQEQVLIEMKRKEAYLAVCRQPVMWLNAAERHKRAADYLYEIAHSADERAYARIEAERNLRADTTGFRWMQGDELNDFLDQRLISEYFLLVGYALECVFKGYLLATRPELIKNEAKLDKHVATHNLRQLCDDCGISASMEESELLSYISMQIVWGKYTGPTRLEDMPSPIDTDDHRAMRLSFLKGSTFHQRSVQRCVNGLFDRAWRMLDAERPTRKHGQQL